MKFTLLHVYTLLSLALVRSHGMSPQVYWKSVLPNSPMPKAIKDLLYTKAWDDGKEKVYIDTTSTYIKLKGQPEQDYSNVASKEEVEDRPLQLYIYGAPKREVKDQLEIPFFYGAPKLEVKDQPARLFKYGEPKREAKDQLEIPFFYGAPKLEVKDQPARLFKYGEPKREAKDQLEIPFFYGAPKLEVKDQPARLFKYGEPKREAKDQLEIPFFYGAPKREVKDQPLQRYIYDAPESEVRDNPIVKLMFLEDKLHQGEEMNLDFMKTHHKTAFLPKNISESIPFSLKDLPQIYNKFSVKLDSVEAEIMKQALSLCENKGIEGEETFCATSLESMIDFTITKLGTKVKALSTEVNMKESTSSQMYKIKLVKKLAANKVVVCHRLNYAYAVFYCHISIGTQSYVVSLDGADGTKVKSMAVCHTDTSKWNPKHLAFQLLKVAPGTSVCHFLPEDHLLWVPY